ncbi:uncharacterized protein LOC113390406 [Ctenocephalides felis]|uniref:uncharacterized protein LOC113390406 n=1 Tax=Ctenocephalides felis TaxID=7515 RepID=UPI000E6E3B2D|nr:uncharacterized protein LOC113390406 [Ctenocephalides felis]
MPPKSASASAEVARLISKREMYFSIIQKTYDLSRDVEDASKLNINDRWSAIKRLNLCSNCLGHKRNSPCHSKKTCLYCNTKHHTLLHSNNCVDNTKQFPTDIPSKNSTQKSFDSNQSNTLCVVNELDLSLHINLMPTATVYVLATGIKTSPLRVIIDTASDRNYVTESFCKSAQLEITPIEAQVISIGHVNDSAANEGYYIPHFAVIKDSSSTPLRIVFDASAKNAEFPSLNANLFSGPKLQSNIITILLNFRFGEIALTADIKQMYRNILIRDQDRRFQRILWRFSPEDPLGIYELNTVTFGITSSPFHALRTIKQLAKDESKNYPLATDIIQNDIYIDDVVTSADTVEIAKQLYVQLSSLFRSACFELAKWASNDRLMYKQFESHHKTQINFSQTISEFDTSVKVLGLRWDPIQDCFKFNINLFHQNWTKRHILSTIARIWDPLGFITPITIKFKMIMKELWLLKLDWDEPLPSSLVATWLSIYNQLPELINLSIPRFEGTKNYIRCSLYGFADSSEMAYGAVIYIKPCHDNKYYLLISKSKITPIKVQSLARNIWFYGLDDCASLVKGPAHRWKTFVANRVTKVHDLLPSAKWYHIPSEANIADCVSRGSLPNTLLNNSNWYTGPSWLYSQRSHWPIRSTLDSMQNVPEEKVSSCLVANSYFNKAELTIIKLIQQIYFFEEIDCLKMNKFPTRYRTLRLFLHDGFLRVGGRLTHANLNFDHKFPLLLPKKDHVINLIIDYYHEKHLHAGTHLLTSILRQRYWILSIRSIVRQRIHKCNKCFRNNPKSFTPIMADLPSPRVMEAKPFQHTGTDYAGPFRVTMEKFRGVKSSKAYICLFICFSTKAIHIELASDLTTSTFLNCFKRFISRRGPVSCLYSDRGTNFVDAKSELKDIFQLINSKSFSASLNSELHKHNINWSFNPPAAPHFGGLWESNIKSIKAHLYRVIGEQILTYEELNTVLIQIEALLNSRPLCWMSSDPSDPQPLTPAHFLTLTPLNILPSKNMLQIDLPTRKQLIDKIIQSYWKRWHFEYLSDLQSRQKWNTPSLPAKKGMLVLIKNENLPPLQWSMGVIEDVFPGKDGEVRTALVRTRATLLKRPVVKLYTFPYTVHEYQPSVWSTDRIKATPSSDPTPIPSTSNMSSTATMNPESTARDVIDYTNKNPWQEITSAKRRRPNNAVSNVSVPIKLANKFSALENNVSKPSDEATVNKSTLPPLFVYGSDRGTFGTITPKCFCATSHYPTKNN